MRELLKATLSVFRMRHFYEAGDGAAAMAKLDLSNVDIAFLDLKHGSMAHLGGIELCREVPKRPESEIRALPLIVVTAYSELRYLKQAVDAGADEFPAKPASAAAIARRINASSSTGVPSSARQTFSVLIAGGDPTRNSKGRSGATTTLATLRSSSPSAGPILVERARNAPTASLNAPRHFSIEPCPGKLGQFETLFWGAS